MDGDSFFVACEVAKNPALRGLPVVTGADRGIVTAASYEAKALGVTRGLPIFRLKKQFPQVIIMPGNYESYSRYSGLMFDIVRRYADDVEEYSIDECFADLTGLDRPLKMSYAEIAARIQREIIDELDLSISVGVAPTKVLAKVASKWKKPEGFTIITEKDAPEYLAQVTIDKIWGIGGQTSWKLKKMGIQTALDLAKKERAWVDEHLSKPYKAIWSELNCVPIYDIDPTKKTLYSSIQKTRTFHPHTSDIGFLFSQLSKHTENACMKARHYGLLPRHVSFFIKTRDFAYVSASIELPAPTNAPEIILPLIKKSLQKIHKKGVLYRTAGITLRELVPRAALEKDLFGNVARADKFEAVHARIDALEEKYGKRLVHLGSTHGAIDNDIIEEHDNHKFL